MLQSGAWGRGLALDFPCSRYKKSVTVGSNEEEDLQFDDSKQREFTALDLRHMHDKEQTRDSNSLR